MWCANCDPRRYWPRSLAYMQVIYRADPVIATKGSRLTSRCPRIPAALWTAGRTAPDEAVSAQLWASWATLRGGSGARWDQGFLSDHILTANLRHASQITQTRVVIRRSIWQHISSSSLFYCNNITGLTQHGIFTVWFSNPIFQLKSFAKRKNNKSASLKLSNFRFQLHMRQKITGTAPNKSHLPAAINSKSNECKRSFLRYLIRWNWTKMAQK